MSTLDVLRIVDFENIQGNNELVQITSDYSGNLLFLLCHTKDDTYLYTIIQYKPNEMNTIYLQETKNIYTHVQPIKDKWLLVEPRVKDTFDKNAHVYSIQGEHKDSFYIGDGVMDVQTTEEGCIWVSYTDDGIIGDSLGSNGLNCFSDEGHLKFSYHNEYHDMIVEGQLAPIDDCYALNVIETENVFLYYYGHFPLVNITNRSSLNIWENVEMEGSHAIAVSAEKVLFDSEYNSSNKVYIYDLTEERIQEFELRCKDEEFSFDYAFARKNTMYFVKDKEIYKHNL